MYFETCHTAEDCKKRYRQLAMELHPDKQGGSTVAFQKMRNEYEKRLNELMNFTESSVEKKKLAQLLLEFLKITQPNLYGQICNILQIPILKIGAKNGINKLFPNQTAMFDEFFNLL